MGEERGIWAGQPGALTVLGELEGVRSLVEEVGGVLVLGAEEAPAREFLLRLLLEVVTASLVITHRLCSCSHRRRRRLDRSLFLLLRGGRRLPAKRESGEETAESGRVGCLCLLRRAGLLSRGRGVRGGWTRPRCLFWLGFG